MAKKKRGAEALKAAATGQEKPKVAPETSEVTKTSKKDTLKSMDKAIDAVADRMDEADAGEWKDLVSTYKEDIYARFMDSKDPSAEIAKFLKDEDALFDLQMEVAYREMAEETAKEEAEAEYEKAVEKATEQAKSEAEIVDVIDDLELVEETEVVKVDKKKKKTGAKAKKKKAKAKAKPKSKAKAKPDKLKGDELRLAQMVGIPRNVDSLAGIKEKFDAVAEQIEDQYDFTWEDFTKQEKGAWAFAKSLVGANVSEKQRMMKAITDTYYAETRGGAKIDISKQEMDEVAQNKARTEKAKKEKVAATETVVDEKSMNNAEAYRYKKGLAEVAFSNDISSVKDVKEMKVAFDQVASHLDFTWKEFTAPDNSFLGSARNLLGMKSGKKKKMMNQFMKAYDNYSMGMGGQKTKGGEYKNREGQDLA